MDDLAYVSSTVLRSVSCRQTGPKDVRGRGVRRREHYLVLPALSIDFPIPPVPHDKSSETAPKISCAPPRCGEKPLVGNSRSCAPQENEMQNERPHAQSRLNNHYEEV